MKGTPLALGISPSHKDWRKLVAHFRNNKVAYNTIYINKYADYQNSPCVEIANEVFIIKLEGIMNKYNGEYYIDARIRIKPDGSSAFKLYDVYIGRKGGVQLTDEMRTIINDEIRTAGRETLECYNKYVRAMWDTADDMIESMLSEINIIINDTGDILAYELDGKIYKII